MLAEELVPGDNAAVEFSGVLQLRYLQLRSL